MKPIISIEIQWRRLGMWIVLHIFWLPYIIKDGFDPDLGPDAQRFYALANIIATLIMVVALYVGYVFLTLGRFELAVLAVVFTYVMIGWIASLILRSSGLIERMLPSV